MHTLTQERVDALMHACLFTEGEDTSTQIVIEGIYRTFGLDPIRVFSHREEILELLAQLPERFGKTGGGWSFMQMPFNRDMQQWGEQLDAEVLMCLGMAIKQVHYLAPRQLWDMLPGGMPYLFVGDLPSVIPAHVIGA